MSNPPAKNSSLRIHVIPKAESAIRGGHPWLFSESIKDQNREGRMGDLAILYDRKDEFLGIGLYDPESPIRVRMLHVGKPQTLDDTWWLERFKEAIEIRRQLFGAETTGFRYIHGENDGWPGLVMDRYGDNLVLKVYTAAWLDRIRNVLKLIQSEISCRRVVLRLSRNVASYLQKIKSDEWRDGQIIVGEALEENIVFEENGIRFEADLIRGQKTGFFLDQRENRQIVETLSLGKRVLNVFSFSGGFSLYAARGGARSVTDLDISLHALENSNRNFLLNQNNPQIKKCEHKTIQADAFDWLKDSPMKYDLIVLDPPSLAKKETERQRAIEAYGRLSGRAIQRLEPKGILVAASCSAHVSTDEFFEAVLQSTKSSGRKFDEIQRTAHPKDHPDKFREAGYLKCIYLKGSS